MGSQMLNRTASYTYKDSVFTTNISGVKNDYYKKVVMRIKNSERIWIQITYC